MVDTRGRAIHRVARKVRPPAGPTHRVCELAEEGVENDSDKPEFDVRRQEIKSKGETRFGQMSHTKEKKGDSFPPPQKPHGLLMRRIKNPKLFLWKSRLHQTCTAIDIYRPLIP